MTFLVNRVINTPCQWLMVLDLFTAQLLRDGQDEVRESWIYSYLLKQVLDRIKTRSDSSWTTFVALGNNEELDIEHLQTYVIFVQGKQHPQSIKRNC